MSLASDSPFSLSHSFLSTSSGHLQAIKGVQRRGRQGEDWRQGVQRRGNSNRTCHIAGRRGCIALSERGWSLPLYYKKALDRGLAWTIRAPPLHTSPPPTHTRGRCLSPPTPPPTPPSTPPPTPTRGRCCTGWASRCGWNTCYPAGGRNRTARGGRGRKRGTSLCSSHWDEIW